MATFTEQSHLEMPPPGWLLVNGVSLSTDVQQQSMYTSDHRTKYILSPPVPTNSMLFTTTMNDKQYQKFENTDSPKKLFIDRQIQKAKALPGLIKGTALSHQLSHHSASAPYTNPTISNLPTNNSQDDALTITTRDNDTDSCRTHRTTNEIRRPRVSFSDFNKVQFFEDSNDNTQQSTNRRHHRHRSLKKSTMNVNNNNNNHVSSPSIQTLHTPYRQQPVGHELNIRKQQLIPSSRLHSSRTTHLPDIVNQPLLTENSNPEKYVLQREKSFFQFPEPTAEITISSSTEISRESTRAGGIRPTAVSDYYDQNDNSVINTLLNSSSISSSFTTRQRPSLRTISLRQQFTMPLKAKPINFSNINQTINSRRSATLKHTVTRNQSVDDDQDDHHVLSTLENRPVTGISNSSKQLKRNYVIHFNSKNPFNGNPTIDSSEINRYSRKSHLHESSPERFQNVLKIVRPPYITSLNNTHPDSLLHQATTTNHMNGSRSSRTTSRHEYHVTSNTIFV